MDRVAAEIYDTHTLSDYVRLNEERHLILKDIQRREQIMDEVLLGKADIIERCL